MPCHTTYKAFDPPSARLSEGRYLVAVVPHDHSDDVEEAIGRYGARLTEAGLPGIPFRGKDLLHGNEASAANSGQPDLCGMSATIRATY